MKKVEVSRVGRREVCDVLAYFSAVVIKCDRVQMLKFHDEH